MVISLLLIDICKKIFIAKKYHADTLKEMYVIGTKALFLVTLGGLFAGIILSILASAVALWQISKMTGL